MWNSTQIKKLRDQLGFTQKQLANKLGVTRRTIIRWESGIRTPNQEFQRRLLQLEANVTDGNVTDENVTDVTDQIVTPEEYFEAAYRDADGYIVLCTITQPTTTEKERGRLYVKGTYSTNSISNLLSDVNELNGQYHIYTNIHPLREPPQQGRGKESDILGVSLFATDTDFV